MNIKNFTISVLSLFFIITSCKSDDDEIELIPLRDEAEVYGEDIEEIEAYLDTHTFNYEEFDFTDTYGAANDNFVLKIDSIPDGNPNERMALSDMTGGEAGSLEDVLQTKTVTQNGIDYTLYMLKIREGQGDNLHSLDRAIVNYRGTLTNDEVFDSAVTPINFNLTSIGSVGGVVTGFREALIEFKTATGLSTAPDGVDTFQGFGIGAVFIPSGLGYFAAAPLNIGPYNPIIFTINLIDRIDTDFDNDGIPSHLEDYKIVDGVIEEGDGDGFNVDRDGDELPDFIDADDDGDGILTVNEDLEDNDPTFDSDGDGDPTNDKDGDGDPTNDDDDGDGIPNYLDSSATESN